MFFGMLTIDNDGFSMVLGLSNHWFQWFSMVKDHWSNDGMVSMDRTGLCRTQLTLLSAAQPQLPATLEVFAYLNSVIIPGPVIEFPIQFVK